MKRSPFLQESPYTLPPGEGVIKLGANKVSCPEQNKRNCWSAWQDNIQYCVLGNHQEWLSDWWRCLFVSLNYKSWPLNEARWLWPFYSILFSLQTADKWMNSTNIWWGFIIQRFNRLQMILNVPRCSFSS